MLRAIKKSFIIGPPLIWLAVFFLVPLVTILKISFSETQIGLPPYKQLVEWIDGSFKIHLHWESYAFLIEDPLYLIAFLNSLKVATISTLLCLIIGFPLAYSISLTPKPWKYILLLLMIIPFWSSFLMRVYAWIGILKDNGILNNILIYIGIIDQPLNILYTDIAVYIGIVYTYLPFMVLPLYANLEKLDYVLNEAAEDLGSTPRKSFINITLPLSIPGIIAGSMLVFIPVVGEFIIPDLLGGPDTLMIGKVLWTEFFHNRDWPVAASIAITLIIIMTLPILLLQKIYAKGDKE